MTNKRPIQRRILIDLLNEWLDGGIDERQVHERAESLMDKVGDAPNYADSDPRSIPFEVLIHLDALNHQLITKDDIPIMREFLATPIGKEADAWKRWREYWNTVDFQARKTELEDHPYYCT